MRATSDDVVLANKSDDRFKIWKEKWEIWKKIILIFHYLFEEMYWWMLEFELIDREGVAEMNLSIRVSPRYNAFELNEKITFIKLQNRAPRPSSVRRSLWSLKIKLSQYALCSEKLPAIWHTMSTCGWKVSQINYPLWDRLIDRQIEERFHKTHQIHRNQLVIIVKGEGQWIHSHNSALHRWHLNISCCHLLKII